MQSKPGIQNEEFRRKTKQTAPNDFLETNLAAFTVPLLHSFSWILDILDARFLDSNAFFRPGRTVRSRKFEGEGRPEGSEKAISPTLTWRPLREALHDRRSGTYRAPKQPLSLTSSSSCT